MRSSIRRFPANQKGFSLLEVAVAAMILIIGLVAVAELVPTWLNSNGANRTNSVALVIGQRILDEMLDQPISAST